MLKVLIRVGISVFIILCIATYFTFSQWWSYIIGFIGFFFTGWYIAGYFGLKDKQVADKEMQIKKLRFVAREMVREYGRFVSNEDYKKLVEIEMARAEQVYYADDVI